MKLRSQIREKLNDLYAGNIKANVMVASWETFVKVRDEILALFDKQEKKHREIDLEEWVKEWVADEEVYTAEVADAIRLYIEMEILE